MELTQAILDRVLSALGEQLSASETAGHELVVIGGSALLALGYANRPTRDVDILAYMQKGSLHSASPLPEALRDASDRVARDFGLDPNWLNPGPTELLHWGLPDGLLDRVTTRKYGPALTIHFIDRLDQIHFKLYAMVDHAGGRHEADLRALLPTRDELVAAARWSTTHDPSPGFRLMLVQALKQLGVEDVDFEG